MSDIPIGHGSDGGHNSRVSSREMKSGLVNAPAVSLRGWVRKAGVLGLGSCGGTRFCATAPAPILRDAALAACLIAIATLYFYTTARMENVIAKMPFHRSIHVQRNQAGEKQRASGVRVSHTPDRGMKPLTTKLCVAPRASAPTQRLLLRRLQNLRTSGGLLGSA